MLYSRAAQNAIRAAAYLATLPRGSYAPVRRVARATRIPPAFLGKIMHRLVRGGIAVSRKGPGGGVALARPPERITLEAIVLAVDPGKVTFRCVLGLSRCSDASPCPAHEIWKELREMLRRSLHEKTLAVMAPSGAVLRTSARDGEHRSQSRPRSRRKGRAPSRRTPPRVSGRRARGPRARPSSS